MGQIPALPFSASISSFRSPVEEERSPVLIMGMEDPSALLWASLYKGNLPVLKKFHELIDFRALHPKTGMTMLLYVIGRSVERHDLDLYPGIEIIQWLLSMGADATQKVSPRLRCKPMKLYLVYDVFGHPYKRELAVPFAGHSAISYIAEFQRVLAENPGQNFKFEQIFLQKFWDAIAHSAPAEEVRQSLMARWGRILNDTSTHTVTFETADNPVTAHDWMLREASLVLKAMLESSMQLGSVLIEFSPHFVVSNFLL